MPLKDKKIGRTIKQPESKDCKVCLRPFTNRKSWSSRDIWEQVLYCSKKCRSMRNNEDFKEKYKNNGKN
jgi:hypothetical protein